MRKITIALILIFMMSGNVLISGCTDKESAIEVISSQSSASSSERAFRIADVEAEQKLYESIQKYPIMESVNVEINNPNVELIGVYVNDARKYEGDLFCIFYVVVQNTGKGDVWLGTYLGGLHKISGVVANHEYYKSGDRRIYIIQGPQTEDTLIDNFFTESKYAPHVNIDDLLNGDITLKVSAYDAIAPKVSPRELGFTLGYSTTQNELFEIESVTYRVDEKNWDFIDIKVNNPNSRELSGFIGLGLHNPQQGWIPSEDSRKAVTISPGGSDIIEFNLKGTPYRNLRSIGISSD